MNDIPQNETRERILAVAEKLFTSRGYSAVRLRDIAQEVGMRHASLYYYAPGGKEGLYVEVMQRNFERHQAGMAQAIADAGSDVRRQIHAVAQWLVTQPPVDLARMKEADLPSLDPQKAQMLGDLAVNAMTIPLIETLARAKAAGVIQVDDPELAAMAFITLMQSVHNIPAEHLPEGLAPLGTQLADMLLYGWLAR